MGAGVNQKKYQLFVVLFPYKKPIGSDMAFLISLEFTI